MMQAPSAKSYRECIILGMVVMRISWPFASFPYVARVLGLKQVLDYREAIKQVL